MPDQPPESPGPVPDAPHDAPRIAARDAPSPPPSPHDVETTAASQPGLVPAEDFEDDDGMLGGYETDSAIGSDTENSTRSVTASIMEYRQIQGRTYHSDRHPIEYFTPNDDKQLESMDINHHSLSILLDDRLYLAPIPSDVQRVLDVGTGSGIWAMDFADLFPNAEIIGSDLSPTQPKWVPPNLHFEIDDCTQEWSWKDNTFDFIHIRYLFGAIRDWNALFQQAYRCCAPGGWVESSEADVEFLSDDGTTELEPVLKTWLRLYEEGERVLGAPFFVQKKGLQEKGLKAAGFTEITSVDYKMPVGGWARDPKLREVGQYMKLTLENDVDGYTLLLWNNVLRWPQEDYEVFLMSMRKALRNRKVHGYMTVRYVYARKPETAEDP